MIKNDPVGALIENFFLPKMEEEASDEVKVHMAQPGPSGEIRWRLVGKRGTYSHELGRERLEAFKGNVNELVDFLSAEMRLSVSRYWSIQGRKE